MNPVRKLKEIEQLVQAKEPKRVAVAYAQDEDTILAVHRAVQNKIITASMVGDETGIVSE